MSNELICSPNHNRKHDLNGENWHNNIWFYIFSHMNIGAMATHHVQAFEFSFHIKACNIDFSVVQSFTRRDMAYMYTVVRDRQRGFGTEPSQLVQRFNSLRA